MSAALVDLNDRILKARTCSLFDDFNEYVDADLWTKLAADSTATVTNPDGTNGLLSIYTDATDNNEAAIKSTRKNWKFLADKSIVFEAKIQYAEAATDDANIAVGFSSVIGANWLLDNGAGPAATQSAAMFYKVDGSTVWKVCTQIGTSATISTSTKTAGGAAYQKLTIDLRYTQDGMEATFRVDDILLIDSTTGKPIKHVFAVTSAAAMHVGAYAKAGGANAETLVVDYISVDQLR